MVKLYFLFTLGRINQNFKIVKLIDISVTYPSLFYRAVTTQASIDNIN